MAEINTDNSGEGFIFGENMEDRVIKPPDSTENENGDEEEGSEPEENGAETTNGSTTSSGTALLRPSAFGKSGSGILAPSKLGNAFSSGPSSASVSPASTSPVSTPVPGDGVPSSTKLAPNPFAVKGTAHAVSTSDSEEERKEKPLVAPAHFGVSTSSSFIKSSASQASPGSAFSLRPSALDRQTAGFKKDPSNSEAYKSSFHLQPAKLQSPLVQNLFGEKSSDKAAEKRSSETSSEPDSSSDSAKAPTLSSESTEGRQRLFGDTGSEGSASTTSDYFSASKKENSTSEVVSNNVSGFLFGQNLDKRITSTTSNNEGQSTGGFVFGENLASRVAQANVARNSDTEQGAQEAEEPPKSTEEKSEDSTSVGSGMASQSLVESAAACQAKQVRPEYQEVEVKTGEEEESNVFQLNAKLHVFDKDAQSWTERGRGQLRLNDISDTNTANSFHSRLVMRTTGSLRVVLNTKIWASMSVDRASQKSIRLTAMDGEDGIKIFLISASPKDADQIFSAIDWRVQQLKMQESVHGKAEEPDSSATPDASLAETPQGIEKRRHDSPEEMPGRKKLRVDPGERRDTPTEESNDSSTVDPETEASNESFASSPNIKSSSSDA